MEKPLNYLSPDQPTVRNAIRAAAAILKNYYPPTLPCPEQPKPAFRLRVIPLVAGRHPLRRDAPAREAVVGRIIDRLHQTVFGGLTFSNNGSKEAERRPRKQEIL